MIRRADSTAWRSIGGETVVVDLDAKRMFGLNEDGARVWEALADGDDAAVIAAELGLDGAAVAAFVAELAAAGLVVGAHGGAPPARDDAGPQITWSEAMQAVAATCAFLPGQNPLCNQAPFN